MNININYLYFLTKIFLSLTALSRPGWRRRGGGGWWRRATPPSTCPPWLTPPSSRPPSTLTRKYSSYVYICVVRNKQICCLEQRRESMSSVLENRFIDKTKQIIWFWSFVLCRNGKGVCFNFFLKVHCTKKEVYKNAFLSDL